MSETATKRKVRRIAFEVSEEKYTILKKHIEHGMMQKVFDAVIEDMCFMLEEYGQLFVLAMLEKRLSYKQYMEKYLEKRAS